MGRTLVLGDIHGAYKALEQVLHRCAFDPETDILISLGDIADGWPETKKCIDLLLETPNLIFIRGNHDQYTIDWAENDSAPSEWYSWGGYATVESYNAEISSEHLHFLKSGLSYYVDQNRLFVHAGIDPYLDLDKQDDGVFLYDRFLFRMAIEEVGNGKPIKFSNFDEIYIGHTPIHRGGYLHPVNGSNVWFMDTGAGWDGVLSLMDIDTKEFWTSDPVKSLYPNHEGRFKQFN